MGCPAGQPVKQGKPETAAARALEMTAAESEQVLAFLDNLKG